MFSAWVVGLGEPCEWSGKCPQLGDVITTANGRRGVVIDIRRNAFFCGRNAQGNVRIHPAQIMLQPIDGEVA